MPENGSRSDAARTLFVTTSHSELGGTGRATGFWFEELAAPWWILHDAGLHADIASIKGGTPPHDPMSVTDEGGKTPAVGRFLADGAAVRALSDSICAADVDPSLYDAVFLVGGHGTMWDFSDSKLLAQIVEHIDRRRGIVAAVCHGVVGLTGARNRTGQALVGERGICGFSNGEEQAVGLSEAVPFLLETRLRELGATYQEGLPFQPNAVRDDNLVTGQNPQSSDLVGRMLLKALVERSSAGSPASA